MGFAWARARFSLPAATALVAMSMKTGPGRSLGKAMQSGFVPSRASRPPNGATAFALWPESAMPDQIGPNLVCGDDLCVLRRGASRLVRRDGERGQVLGADARHIVLR